MTARNKKTQRAKTQFTSEELVAKGFAMKDSTGAYSELILLYEEPGAKGRSFWGKARLDARGNAFPCLRRKGKKTVLVTDVSVVGDTGGLMHLPLKSRKLPNVHFAYLSGVYASGFPTGNT